MQDLNQIDKLLDFLSTFQDKFSSGILRLHRDGSGSFYNASYTGINAKKEIKFKNTKELKKLINSI